MDEVHLDITRKNGQILERQRKGGGSNLLAWVDETVGQS